MTRIQISICFWNIIIIIIIIIIMLLYRNLRAQ